LKGLFVKENEIRLQSPNVEEDQHENEVYLQFPIPEHAVNP